MRVPGPDSPGPRHHVGLLTLRGHAPRTPSRAGIHSSSGPPDTIFPVLPVTRRLYPFVSLLTSPRQYPLTDYTLTAHHPHPRSCIDLYIIGLGSEIEHQILNNRITDMLNITEMKPSWRPN